MLSSSRLGRADYLAFFLAVAFLPLGVWRLVTGDTGFGVFLPRAHGRMAVDRVLMAQEGSVLTADAMLDTDKPRTK